MKIKIIDVFEIVNSIPLKDRIALKGVYFVIENEMVHLLKDGGYAKAEWSNGGVITIFPLFIKDKEDLRKTLIHEIGHHIGADHKLLKEFGL